MAHRIPVTAACTPACPSCIACKPGGRPATLERVAAHRELPEVILGGGDATRWPSLAAYLEHNRSTGSTQRVWVEAPARALTAPVLDALARRGVHGVLVQIEGAGEAMLRVLSAGDGEEAIALAEARGLEAQARLCVRPKTFGALAAVAERIAPRLTWLELVRQDWGKPEVPIWPGPIARLLLMTQSVSFTAHRMHDRGYLPPCVLPQVWSTRPTAWRSVLAPRDVPNDALPGCASCGLRTVCQFGDAGALAEEVRADVEPIATSILPWQRPRATEREVPAAIVHQRPPGEVLCVTPWTTMEIVDPNGKARQCCSTWTLGDRGSVLDAPLSSVWNGPGYQEARRIMSGEALDGLCLPICSRLHDRKFSEKSFRIQTGSDAFVKNQLLIAEDIAQRREVVRSKPLRMAVCPSTYCNYDCIMCDHGRTERRELPESIWDELPSYLPTLRSLTLLGGEPLANPLAMRFLRDFDAVRYPDCAVDVVTNGSLLTERVLATLRRCTFGDVTISVNAGTAEVYERVQRGIAFEGLLENLDALVRYRDAHERWFGITLSFVVQPASAHTLVEFGEIANRRNLRIRLMALNPENHEGLDFYTDPDAVAKVVEDVDRFVAYAERVRPDWVSEIAAARTAVLEEAAARRSSPRPAVGGARRLPVVP